MRNDNVVVVLVKPTLTMSVMDHSSSSSSEAIRSPDNCGARLPSLPAGLDLVTSVGA